MIAIQVNVTPDDAYAHTWGPSRTAVAAEADPEAGDNSEDEGLTRIVTPEEREVRVWPHVARGMPPASLSKLPRGMPRAAAGAIGEGESVQEEQIAHMGSARKFELGLALGGGLASALLAGYTIARARRCYSGRADIRRGGENAVSR